MPHLALFFLVALAAAGGDRPPEAEVTRDGDLERIVADAPAGSTGYLYRPKGVGEGERTGLVVMCHGHGGTPKGVVRRELADQRRWSFLSVQGGGIERSSEGEGFSWSTPDVERILALTRWTIANRPIDPDRVVLIGFSAGGTMVLETWPRAPKMYRGVVTCSSPATPGSRHDAARIAVFLGTEDPNHATAGDVRPRIEKPKGKGRIALFEVDGGEHNDLPEAPYLDLAIGWILRPKAAGREVRVPKNPPAGAASDLRHVLVSYTKAEGAPAGLKRKKSSAKSLARRLRKLVKSGREWLPLVAQGESADPRSAPLGGRITMARLVAYGGDLDALEAELEDAKPGEVLGPFESPAGFHLVSREASAEAP